MSEPVWVEMGTRRYWKELVGIDRVDDDELRQRIEALSEDELFDFYWTTQIEVEQLILGGHTKGIPEDVRRGIGNWIVRQGLRTWEDYDERPEAFPRELPDDPGLANLSTLVADLYAQRYGVAIADHDPRQKD